MKRQLILIFLAAMGLAATVSACGDSTDCSSDGDCFSGEYCSDGTCITGERPIEMNNANNVNNSNNVNNANNANNVNNSGSNNVNNANNINSGTNNLNNINNANNTNNTNNVVGDYACLVDPFDPPMCELDDNDSFPDYFHDRTVACQNDGFVPLDKTISASICLRETVDKYTQLYVECDQSFIFEVTLTPKTPCDPSLYKFDVFIAGLSCDDDGIEEGIRCETLSDGSQRAQVIVPPGRSVSSGRIEIEALEPDTIQFDYDLNVVIRQ